MEWKSILADLFRAYRKEGAPFALVHLALVAWFLFELGRLVHEAWALHKWQPGKQHSTICTQTLNVFVRESEELAPQGFLVPLTDFTDRLDSVVDGMVGRVHDLANLFLVVGIAGTVFGLFYFAVQSTGAESAQLGEILAQGLKTAFPVVFVGLCLYVLAHTLASFPEHFLRKWLAEATDLGLERRRRLARSQAEVLRNALEPIKNLKDVLTGAVEPAINQFRERLDQSFQIVAFQMTALREAVKAVQDSVRSVENGIQSLRTVSEDVRVVLTGAPVMLKKIDELHEQQVKRLQDLSGAIAAIEFKTAETFQRIQDTAEHFSSALKEFQALPDNLRQQLASGVVELFAGTVTQLNAIIGQFEDLPTRLRDSVQEGLNEVSLGLRDIGGKTVEELRERVIQLVEGIERSSKNATTALEGSANRLQDVASEAHRVLGTAFSEAVNVVADQAQRDLPRLEEMFANKVPNALEETNKLVEGLAGLVSQLDESRRSLGQLLTDVNSRMTLPPPVAGYEPLISVLQQFTQELSKMSSRIRPADGEEVLSSIADMKRETLGTLDRLMERSRPSTLRDWAYWAKGILSGKRRK